MIYIGTHDDPFTMGDEITYWGDNDIGANTDMQLRQSLFFDEFEVTNGEFFEFYRSGEFEELLEEGLERVGYNEVDRRILREHWSIPQSWPGGQPPANTERFPPPPDLLPPRICLREVERAPHGRGRRMGTRRTRHRRPALRLRRSFRFDGPLFGDACGRLVAARRLGLRCPGHGRRRH